MFEKRKTKSTDHQKIKCDSKIELPLLKYHMINNDANSCLQMYVPDAKIYKNQVGKIFRFLQLILLVSNQQ